MGTVLKGGHANCYIIRRGTLDQAFGLGQEIPDLCMQPSTEKRISMPLQTQLLLLAQWITASAINASFKLCGVTSHGSLDPQQAAVVISCPPSVFRIKLNLATVVLILGMALLVAVLLEGGLGNICIIGPVFKGWRSSLWLRFGPPLSTA